jgi:hypothetical protein
MATVYKEFLLKNKISNMIPVQVDNTKPIEIIIHLKLDNDKGLVDICELINKREQQSINPKIDSPSVVQRRKCKALQPISRLIEHKSEFKAVRFSNIIGLNQFFLHLYGWEEQFEKLKIMMRSDYVAENNRAKISHYNISDLKKNLMCALVFKEGEEWAVRRAVIYELKMANQNSNAQVKLYLLDLGTFHTASSVSGLFPLLDKYLVIEPLCFECTLSDVENEPLFKMNTRKSSNELVLEKFTQFVIKNKYFKLKSNFIKINIFSYNYCPFVIQINHHML